MFEDRPVRDGLAALVVLMLVALVAYYVAPRRRAVIVMIEAAKDTLAANGPVVRVNADGPRKLRKAGFSNFHIARMMYLRSCGYAFRSDSDLLVLPYADTMLIESLKSRLDFSAPDSVADVAELAALFRRNGQYASHSRWHDNGSSDDRARRAYSPRIPLFAADSVTMAEAGMSPDAWDSLAVYQNNCVVRGSLPLDSLVALSASELSAILRRNSSPRRAVVFLSGDEAEGGEESPVVVVDINVASREQLMAVRGIGEKTADAILDLRRCLGGFVSVEQIKDVWTLTPERFVDIEPSLFASPGCVKPVNVNSANDTRLRRHPYFPPLLAARIAQVRLQKNGAKLSRTDVEHCAEGIELSAFFWDYVAY